jgi:hypothetical protein
MPVKLWPENLKGKKSFGRPSRWWIVGVKIELQYLGKKGIF